MIMQRLTAFLVLCTLLCLGMGQLKPGQLTQAQIQLILDVHNAYRRLQNASNMNILKWNETLAEMAYNYLQLCKNEHGQPLNPRSPFLFTGQNIHAISPKRPANYTLAILRWYEEIKYYDYESNKCAPSKVCGHYTQVVWADTMFVGCAAVNCTYMLPQKWYNVTMTICNYGPAGNLAGNSPYETGEGCSMCPDEAECIDNLCDTDY